MLVVISIIGLLIGLLIPAITNARNQAKVAVSESNLRQLGIAHSNYASEWNDRQFTLTRDDIASFGLTDFCTQGAVGSVQCLHASMLNQGYDTQVAWPPPVILGWASTPGFNSRKLVALTINNQFQQNYVLLTPIAFTPPVGGDIDKPRFGYFRLPNAQALSQYVSGRFFDEVFFAPKDRMVMSMRDEVEGDPSEFPDFCALYANAPGCSASVPSLGWADTDFCYSSYSLSPAALFSPDVLRTPGAGGWQDPWSLPAGMRAPSMSQARYSNLKTHMLEHHWLQGRPGSPCNGLVTEARERPYKDCQPYFFNQSEQSSPVTLFYDGHVNLIGVYDAQAADGRMQAQTGVGGSGLWSRDTPFGADGYWSSRSYDNAHTSFHILTTDGIRGRDIIAASD